MGQSPKVELVRWLDEIAAVDGALVGGKGANLARLLRMGLPVPPGFVVTTHAYRDFVAARGSSGHDPEDLRERLLASTLPDEIGSAILAAYQRLGTPNVAVRSSGTAEDLATASFAGQHDTFLNVSGDAAVLDAVRRCWASLWSPRAVDYRRQHGWDDRELAIAVVVQAMVPAEWAGVIFTADPVTGRRDRLVVEAVPGLGEALVSGEARGSRAVFDRTNRRVVEGDGALPAGALDAIVDLALKAEAGFGKPQDVEWAWARGRGYVLQARPLTALREEPLEHAEERPRRYHRLQLAAVPALLDHIPLALYPFDYSVFVRPFVERMLASVRSIGLATSPVDQMFVETEEGVFRIVPPLVRPTPRALLLPWKLLRSLRLRPDDWVAECRHTLVALADRFDADDLNALSERDLLDRIATLRDAFLAQTPRRFAHVPRLLLAGRVLSIVLRLAVGDRARDLERDLLAEVPCVTTRANRDLARLARRVRDDEVLRRLFLETDPEDLPARLDASDRGRALRAAVDVFLRQYGRRETTMPSAVLPAWRDDPTVVYGLVKGLAAAEPRGSDEPPVDGDRADRARRVALGAFVGWKRSLAPVFSRLLDATRAGVAYREDSHYTLMLPMPVIRRLALELGRRLVRRRMLDWAEDVFFLRLDELAGSDPPPDLAERVRRRKATRQAVGGRSVSVPADLLDQAFGSEGVSGTPASHGQVVGVVRVVRSERDFWKLESGEVLVAPYTNPSWTPLFALAAAVVVDAGGATSHAAIVAREYGIPAVMGTGNATARLRDGQRVLVDGDAGRVVPIEAGDDGGG